MQMRNAIKSLLGGSMGALLLLGATASPSHATAVTLTGTGTDGRSASVTFDTFSFLSTNYLSVVLTNTATYDSRVPSEILTAIFFNLPGDPTLSRTSFLSGAGVPLGSTVKNNPAVTDVGTEWAYNSGLSVDGFSQGISSTGLGLFGPSDRFITCTDCDLQGPDSPNGIEYGVTTSNDLGDNDNGGLSGQHLIKNSVVFYLGGIDSLFDPSTAITNVRFQYGTSLSEPYFGPGGCCQGQVPQPSSLALLGSVGILGALMFARRRWSRRPA
jgi:hypothetical protein